MRGLPLVLILLAATACRRADPSAAIARESAVPVHFAIARLEKLPVLAESPATIRPAERANLSAKITGTVATFPAALGQAVTAGEILVTLDAPDAMARVGQARAQLAEAERNAARQRTLVASGANPADALRDAEDRLRFAQASVAEAEALLGYGTVRAPFAGVITEKNLLPGDLATPGTPLLALESNHRLRAEGSVPEKIAATLKIGDAIGVVLDDASASLPGRLEEIAGAADPGSRSVLVKVALPAGAARSGQFARLQIAGEAADTLLVPAAAVTHFGQMERLFVIEQGRAVLRLVKTGRAAGNRIEILSGLEAGEQMVLAPPTALRDGQLVTPQP